MDPQLVQDTFDLMNCKGFTQTNTSNDKINIFESKNWTVVCLQSYYQNEN